ncbi:MAG: hypothetical protein MUF38_00020 [Anaerolineae bacterium]|jgi:hypothetical protein|nr:hypothetical protein [Anaerolineae bacterium]
MLFSKYAALILILWSILGSWQASAQDDAEIPYIHYYSDLLGGLVIERADGTDSRVLDIEAGFVDWSPSGKWFTVKDIAIFSTDGSQRIPYPQESTGYQFYTRWSPTDDVLLLAGISGYGSVVRAQLYDVATQTILADFSFSNPPYEISNLSIEWSSSGREAYVFWYNHLITLSRDGTTQITIQPPFQDYTFGSLFDRGRLLSKDITMYPETVPLFTIRDLETDVWRSVDQLTWSQRSVIRWNPPRDHALLYTPDCPEEDCEPILNLLNWETGRITPISPNLPILSDDLYCEGNYLCTNMWSPDGRYAVLADEDQRTLYLLDTQTGETTPLSVWGIYEWVEGDMLLIKASVLYRYDPATDELTALDITVELAKNYAPDFWPSPDGRFIGLLSDPTFIINSATGKLVTQTAPHSASTGSIRYPVYGYQWNASETWAMADYNIFFAGGGVGPRASVVFDLAGTVRRELPSGGLAGFVPERVIPYLSPGQPRSLKTDPIYTLTQQGQVRAVGWHPTDPNQLVTYSDEAGLVFWSLEGQPHITRQVMPTHLFPTHSSFQRGLKLVWMPERDQVGFSQGLEIYILDEETGEPITLSSVERATVETLLLDYLAQQPETDDLLHMSQVHLALSSDRSVVFAWDTRNAPDLTYLVNLADHQIVSLKDGQYRNIFVADVRFGIMAAGGIYEDTILIFDAQTGQLIDEWDGTGLSLAISSDGRWLATTSNGMTSIWELPAAVISE